MRQSSHVNPIPIEPFKHIDKYHQVIHLLRAFCCIIHSCHPHLCTDDAVVLIACFVFFLHNTYDCYDPTSLEDPAKIPLAASLVLIYGGNDWHVLHVHYSTHGGSNMVLLSLSTEMSCVLCAMFHLCENPQCISTRCWESCSIGTCSILKPGFWRQGPVALLTRSHWFLRRLHAHHATPRSQ